MSDEVTKEPAQLQVEQMQQWLKLAPEPPERGDNTYDVFISYRSSDRAWAMALYDALTSVKWKPFLDQYELIPGTALNTSLAQNLKASSSGVILWSKRTGDSKWCERERNQMVNLKDKRENTPHPFNYIFAKLDEEPLPDFADTDLYTSFEDSPEGPRGVNLLRMICGMKGCKLAPEAVNLAQQVDEDAKRAMISVRGAVGAANPARLFEIGTSAAPGILASPGPILAAAQGLISMNECEKALEVLRRAEAYFPKSIRVTQLKGLALRRLKRFQEAIDVLSELEAAGHQDPETLGILAAAWDGLHQQSGKTKSQQLRSAREMYRTAFQADPKSYYTGINAASKSLFLGEQDEADRLATLVFPLVEASSDCKDFWAACTLGEVYLLQRKTDEAAAQYQKVIDKYPGATGDLGGTRQQAGRICVALGLSEEESKKVLAPFDLLDEG